MAKDNNDNLFIWGLLLVGLLWFLMTREQKAQTSQRPTLPEALRTRWQRNQLPLEAVDPNEQVVYKNTEEWEIVNDPATGDIAKIIVHRTATRNK